jgi:vacuolar-type H+-ATPase subunit H
MGTTLLSDLEQAELASRARLLAAAAEADRRVDAARAVAAQIVAGSESEVDGALATLRDRYREQGDLEIAAVETELARIEETTGDRVEADAAFDSATAAIVAAVLGETGA